MGTYGKRMPLWAAICAMLVIVMAGGSLPTAAYAKNAAASSPGFFSQAIASEIPQVTGCVRVKGRRWLPQKSGTCVKLGASGKNRQVEAMRLSLPNGLSSGSIVYQAHVQGKGWMPERTNGQIAGTVGKDRRLEAVKIRLTGAISNGYDVWYRVRVSGIGWLAWTRNGKAAGSKGYGKRVWTVQVAIAKKGVGHPAGNNKYSVSFVQGKNIYQAGLKRVSGNVALDRMLAEFVKRNHIGTGKKGLRKAYDIIATYGYNFDDVDPKGSWKKWSVSMAKQMYTRGYGNCYRYASLMCWVARYLGYNAKVVAGHHWRSDHSLASHGWCEVNKGGKLYVIDPNFHHNHPEKNFFMVTYDKTPLEYLK